MITKNIIHLASASPSRKRLLQEAQIPFTTIQHNSSENYDVTNTDIKSVVGSIAQCKMRHAVVPQGTEGQRIYVLTADTMTCDKNGSIYGKPTSRDNAIAIIKALRDSAIVATGFCLEKKCYTNNQWITTHAEHSVVVSTCQCNVPDSWIEYYITNTNALNIAGALMVDELGSLFIKTIHGSYTNILGLPMYELRQALEHCDFFAF